MLHHTNPKKFSKKEKESQKKRRKQIKRARNIYLALGTTIYQQNEHMAVTKKAEV